MVSAQVPSPNILSINSVAMLLLQPSKLSASIIASTVLSASIPISCSLLLSSFNISAHTCKNITYMNAAFYLDSKPTLHYIAKTSVLGPELEQTSTPGASKFASINYGVYFWSSPEYCTAHIPRYIHIITLVTAACVMQMMHQGRAGLDARFWWPLFWNRRACTVWRQEGGGGLRMSHQEECAPFIEPAPWQRAAKSKVSRTVRSPRCCTAFGCWVSKGLTFMGEEAIVLYS